MDAMITQATQTHQGHAQLREGLTRREDQSVSLGVEVISKHGQVEKEFNNLKHQIGRLASILDKIQGQDSPKPEIATPLKRPLGSFLHNFPAEISDQVTQLAGIADQLENDLF